MGEFFFYVTTGNYDYERVHLSGMGDLYFLASENPLTEKL